MFEKLHVMTPAQSSSSSSTSSSPPARKRGRHRVFTDEERKNRNRQAQAAFRAKKTEYVSILEEENVDLQSAVDNLKDQVADLTVKLDEKEMETNGLKSEIERLKGLWRSIVDGRDGGPNMSGGDRVLRGVGSSVAVSMPEPSDVASASAPVMDDLESLFGLTPPPASPSLSSSSSSSSFD
ncbi:hypothetical protein HK104_005625, partial [Borealophlyctis nickersoniae]